MASRETFPSLHFSARKRQRSGLTLLEPLPAGEKDERLTLPVAPVHLVGASSFLWAKKIAALHPVGPRYAHSRGSWGRGEPSLR